VSSKLVAIHDGDPAGIRDAQISMSMIYAIASYLADQDEQ